jgi:hypothetical protein
MVKLRATAVAAAARSASENLDGGIDAQADGEGDKSLKLESKWLRNQSGTLIR